MLKKNETYLPYFRDILKVAVVRSFETLGLQGFRCFLKLRHCFPKVAAPTYHATGPTNLQAYPEDKGDVSFKKFANRFPYYKG
jgi:hypothetical protein